MQINIVIEIDRPEDGNEKICDGIMEACLVAVVDMRLLGHPAVDEERYVTSLIDAPAIGQVSYFRPS